MWLMVNSDGKKKMMTRDLRSSSSSSSSPSSSSSGALTSTQLGTSSKIPGPKATKCPKGSDTIQRKKTSNKVNDIGRQFKAIKLTCDQEKGNTKSVDTSSNGDDRSGSRVDNQHGRSTSYSNGGQQSTINRQPRSKSMETNNNSSRVKLIPGLFNLNSSSSRSSVKPINGKDAEKDGKKTPVRGKAMVTNDTGKTTIDGKVRCRSSNGQGSKRIPSLPAISKLTRNKLDVVVLKQNCDSVPKSHGETPPIGLHAQRPEENVARVSPIKRASIGNDNRDVKNFIDNYLGKDDQMIGENCWDNHSQIIKTDPNVGSKLPPLRLGETIRRAPNGTVNFFDRSALSDSECHHSKVDSRTTSGVNQRQPGQNEQQRKLISSPIRQRYPRANRARISSSLSPLLESPPRSGESRSLSYVPSYSNVSRSEESSNELKAMLGSSSRSGSTYSLNKGDLERHEIMRLRQELSKAKDQIESLNNQLASNVHMMGVFERTLQAMRCRMSEVTQNSERKEREITDLMATIEFLRNEVYFCDDELDKDDKRENNHSNCHQQKNQQHGWLNKVLKRNKGRNKSPSKEFPLDHHDAGNHQQATINLQQSGDKQQTNSSNNNNNNISRSAPCTPKFMMKHNVDIDFGEDVCLLRRQLAEKEKMLTDLRLELLSTENQVEDLRESTNKLALELMNMREENKRLQSIFEKASLGSTTSSSSANDYKDSLITTAGYNKRVVLALDDQLFVASFNILTTTTWPQLDGLVKAKFTEYLADIDQRDSLDLSEEDISSYEIGRERIKRRLWSDSSEASPELLPYGYLVEDSTVLVNLRTNLDYLVIESCTSKTAIKEIVSCLQKERRVAIVGQKGSGKSFIAQKVAQYLVHNFWERAYSHDGDHNQSILVFTVKPKSDATARDFLSQLVTNRTRSGENFPRILILEDIHSIDDVDEVFSPLDHHSILDLPMMIATSVDTGLNLQYLALRQGFKSVNWLCLMRDFQIIINRFLKKKIISEEAQALGTNNSFDWAEMSKICAWIPQVWKELNNRVDSRSKKPVDYMSIEPFLFCPMDVEKSREWFMNFWNLIIIPFLRKHLDTDSFEMITSFVRWIQLTYPWSTGKENLVTIGDLDEEGSINQDSFLETLLKLQDVACHQD